MSAQILSFKGFGLPARPEQQVAPPQTLAEQLPQGRLIELLGGGAAARFTAAVSCLRMAQARGETTAWVQRAGGALFPPDLYASGIDLDALVVVQVPERAGAHGPVKAAELLLRSGGFGMVVVDLSVEARGGALERDLAWQGRLLGMAREHGSWVLLVGPGSSKSGVFGPLVSLCVEPRRSRTAPGRFAIEPHIRKDKSGLLGALLPAQHHAPSGLL